MADNCDWFALYVKSRHEFVTESELRRRGVETFLPSVKRLSHWKDRKKYVEFPLFPGYIFVLVPACPGAFGKVLEARGAVTFISLAPGRPTSIPQEEIISIKRLIESGQAIDIYPQLKEGTKVRVRRGPLRGAEGILLKKEDQYMFLVRIEILGRCVGVRVYAEDVEAV